MTHTVLIALQNNSSEEKASLNQYKHWDYWLQHWAMMWATQVRQMIS